MADRNNFTLMVVVGKQNDCYLVLDTRYKKLYLNNLEKQILQKYFIESVHDN